MHSALIENTKSFVVTSRIKKSQKEFLYVFLQVSNQAKSLLEYLFVENTTKFSSILTRLESYPDTNDFSILYGATSRYTDNQSLEHMLTNFLIIADNVPEEFIANSLTILKHSLTVKLAELSNLIESSPNLIYTLVKKLFVLMNSKKQSISTLSMECLGVLGPIELSPTESAETPVMSDMSRPATFYIKIVTSEILKQLKSSHGQSSLQLFKTLQKIFSTTQEGANFNFNELEKNASLMKALQDKKTTSNSNHNSMSTDSETLDMINDSPVWNCDNYSYEEWLKKLTDILLQGIGNNTVLSCMSQLCKSNVALCELIFPYIIHEYLLANVEIGIVISSKINDTISNLIKYDQTMNDGTKKSSDKQKKKLLVDLISYLRSVERPQELVNNIKLQSWENNFWIGDIDYLAAAQLALDCDEYLSAILFSELWISQQDFNLIHSERNHFRPILSHLQISCPDATESLKEILTKSSLKLEDKDMTKGISTILSKSSDIKSLTLVDIVAEKCPESRTKLVNSMYESGMFHTLSQYIGSLESEEKAKLSDLQAECSWNLGKWDDIGSTSEDTPSFNRCILGGLQAVRQNDNNQLENWTNLAQVTLKNNSLVGTISSKTDCNLLLTKLKQISEIQLFTDNKKVEDIERIIKTCLQKDALLYKSSCKLEQVYNLRKALVDCSVSLSSAQSQKENVELCSGARKAGYYPFCYRIIEQLSEQNLPDLQVETAKIQWQQGFQKEAIQTACNVKTAANQDTEFYANLLVTLGNWMNIQRTESSSVILEEYYLKAVQILEKEVDDKSNEKEGLIEAYISLAKLADQHFRKADEYIESSEFKERKENLEIRLKEDRKWKEQRATEKNHAVKTAFVIKERFAKLDKLEIERCYKDREHYLDIAIENYMKVLQHGNNSLAVYRFLSLWLGNSELQAINTQAKKI